MSLHCEECGGEDISIHHADDDEGWFECACGSTEILDKRGNYAEPTRRQLREHYETFHRQMHYGGY